MPNYHKKNYFIIYREPIITSVFMLFCLFLAIVFPVNPGSSFQILTKGLFFLVIIPALYIKIILRKNLSDFGLNIKNKHQGIFWASVMLLVSLLASWLLMKIPGVKNTYTIPVYAAGSFWLFIAYELILINIFIFTYEFFWRGFVMFTFSPKLRWWAVFIQGAVFILFSLFNKDFNWKYFSLPVLSVTAGIVSYKAKSFIFSYVMSLIFIILLDSYLIYSLNK